MVQRICPICNKTMKHSHYCGGCKSWIKEPYIQNVSYYLNERHPENERSCSYHSVSEGNERGGSRTWQASAFGGETATESGNTAGWYIQNIPDAKGRSWVPWGIAGVVAVGAVLAILAVVGFVMIAQNASKPDEESDIFLEEWSIDYDGDPEDREGEEWNGEDWEEDNFRELEDAEVIEAGIACNGDGHFPISGAEMEILLEEILESYGIREYQIDRYSYNEEYLDEFGTVTSTYYSTYVDFNFEEDWDEGVGEYLELDYDTATGELHSIMLVLRDKETLTALALEILQLVEKKSGMPEGSWSDSVKRDMPRVLETKNGYGLVAGDLAIRGSCQEGDYCFSIDFVQ